MSAPQEVFEQRPDPYVEEFIETNAALLTDAEFLLMFPELQSGKEIVRQRRADCELAFKFLNSQSQTEDPQAFIEGMAAAMDAGNNLRAQTLAMQPQHTEAFGFDLDPADNPRELLARQLFDPAYKGDDLIAEVRKVYPLCLEEFQAALFNSDPVKSYYTSPEYKKQVRAQKIANIKAFVTELLFQLGKTPLY